MSNGKQNNYESWKSKLDDLDSLPGETIPDKNEQWEKLYSRLGGKKRSRKSIWYWVAAVCILFVLLIPPLFYKSNDHQVSFIQKQKNNTEPESHTIKNSFKKGIDEKDSSRILNSSIVINMRAKTETLSPKKNRKYIYEKQMNIIRLADTVSKQNILPEAKSNSLSPMDTFSSLAISTPIRKKLKVVHINELGDPLETLPGTVRNTDKHSFEFKIANQGIYINPAIASNTSGFTIFKIISSQN